MFSDNKNVQSVLKIVGRKQALHNIAMEVNEIYDQNKIEMTVEWIPRSLNKKAII